VPIDAGATLQQPQPDPHHEPDQTDTPRFSNIRRHRRPGRLRAPRAGGANFLLDVPPDKHGLIPAETVAALTRLRKNLKL
jgi:hypothetical protein